MWYDETASFQASIFMGKEKKNALSEKTLFQHSHSNINLKSMKTTMSGYETKIHLITYL